MNHITDGEVEGLNAWAAFSGGGVVGIVTGSSVGSAVPSVAFTSGIGELLGLAVVDSEVQGLSSRATGCRCRFISVVTTEVVSGAVPSVGVAGSLGEFLCLTIVDGKRKCFYRRQPSGVVDSCV